jgi:hypothetical protein
MDKMTVLVRISIACTSGDWTHSQTELMETKLEDPIRGQIISIGYAIQNDSRSSVNYMLLLW